jgi:hypothetical protein
MWIFIFYKHTQNILAGRDSSVGIATRYGLDSSMVKTRVGGKGMARFSAQVQTGTGVHPTFFTVGSGAFPGLNQLGRGVDHSPSTWSKVKERTELYTHSPLGLCALF